MSFPSLLKIVALWLVTTTVLAQNSSFTRQNINDQLSMLQGRGGNIAVLQGAEGLLLVDNDYAEMYPALQEILKTYGEHNIPRYVVNTHWHSDHTGNNEVLSAEATIVAHQNVLLRLAQAQTIWFVEQEGKTEAAPREAWPRLTYDSVMSMRFNRETVTLVHLPNGHTDGDSLVLFEQSNTLHMGDLYFNGRFPFVDINAGGNVVQYAENVALVLSRIDDDTIIIPGHGALSNKAELRTFHGMLTASIEAVSAMKKSGMSLSEAQAEGLDPRWESYGAGFINQSAWIALVYSSL